MKTLHNWKLKHETWEEQSTAGRYNPGLQVIIGKLRLPISAGGSDNVYVFSQEKEIFVLNINYRLQYVGLQIFSSEGELLHEIFVDSDENIDSTLGRPGLKLSPMTICKRLQEYCY